MTARALLVGTVFTALAAAGCDRHADSVSHPAPAPAPAAGAPQITSSADGVRIDPEAGVTPTLLVDGDTRVVTFAVPADAHTLDLFATGYYVPDAGPAVAGP